MSKSTSVRGFQILLGIGWYSTDPNEIKGDRSVTGEVTSSKRESIYWAKRSRPRCGGFDVLRRCRAQHDCLPDDIVEVERPLVIAPKSEWYTLR